MLISMVWGLLRGVRKSVGVVMTWDAVQAAMEHHHQQMVLYSPFGLMETAPVRTGPLFANMRLLALQHWTHLWHRDLIGKATVQVRGGGG